MKNSNLKRYLLSGGIRESALLFVLIVTGFGRAVLAQGSVEKIETTQEASKPVDSSKLARDAVLNPGTKQAPNETGRIIGDYSVTTALELGYRFIDAKGSNDKFRSDLNLRDGLRVLDFQFDSRSISGQGLLYDYLRGDVSNGGGDGSQHYYFRAEKNRAYRFDGTVRQFNYYRFLPGFGNGQHNYDVDQQSADYNLKLFPQRAVRLNLGYSRAMIKGPFTSTYDYERDEFPTKAKARWEANDYRLGFDATWHRWDFFLGGMYRFNKNDFGYPPDSSTNPGNNATNNSRLTFISRDMPTRSKALLTRGSIHGDITSRVHLVFRGTHTEERISSPLIELTQGTDANNRKILSRLLTDSGYAKRPSSTADGAITFDLSPHFSLSNTVRYTAFRILGDRTETLTSQLQPVTGPVQNTTTTNFTANSTDLTSIWNTLQLQYSLGRKFSANGGWRATHRTVTLNNAGEIEGQTNNTNTFLGGFRVRPNNRLNFFLDYEHGSLDSVFVRVNPRDFQRFRVRASIQATETLSFTSTFSTTDTTNPTRQVENNGDYRAYSVSATWEPNPRLWVVGGYDYDYLFNTANIFYFNPSNVLNEGKSIFYARQNLAWVDSRFGLTSRLDFFLVYRYIRDLGTPANVGVPTGPNDFVTSFPLNRHNPEARLAVRFNNQVTGNVSFRHYSYNEKLFSFQDYRANIVTTSLRFTF